MPNVVMISAWKNDVNKLMDKRVEHLLSKTYPNLRWLWVEGDGTDNTHDELKVILSEYQQGSRVTLVHQDTGVQGNTPEIRLKRLSDNFNIAMSFIHPSDDYIIWHESDLSSPPDIVERFLELGKDCVGGWPILPMNGKYVFYDTWGYRANGKNFMNLPPYHEAHTPGQPYQVDTIGSVFMFPVKEVIGNNPIRLTDGMCCVELYRKLKLRGYEVWVDPRIVIIQPHELWSSQEHFGLENG